MTPSDYEMVEQGYDPPRMNEGELVYTGPGELAALRTRVAKLEEALRELEDLVVVAGSQRHVDCLRAALKDKP